MENLRFLINRMILPVLLFIIILPGMAGGQTEPIVKIHYLGHSSFILQFDNGVTVVTDYGKENAWVQWGWNSPIYSINNLVPHIITYSHTHHEDHYAPARKPTGVQYTLTGNDELILNDVTITPIRVCEESINNADNTAFLFTYKGFKILHLGDAQADIINIGNAAVRNRILNNIPQSLDLLFMTIEGPSQFILQAEVFVDLLKPKRIIPMHYWSTQYKLDFIAHCESQNGPEKNYQKDMRANAKYELDPNETITPVMIISLTAGQNLDITDADDIETIPSGYALYQNYPNPFNAETTITYSLLDAGEVEIVVFDSIGGEVARIVNEYQNAGTHNIKYNASSLVSGVYIYSLHANNFIQNKKMLLMK